MKQFADGRRSNWNSFLTTYLRQARLGICLTCTAIATLRWQKFQFLPAFCRFAHPSSHKNNSLFFFRQCEKVPLRLVFVVVMTSNSQQIAVKTKRIYAIGMLKRRVHVNQLQVDPITRIESRKPAAHAQAAFACHLRYAVCKSLAFG